MKSFAAVAAEIYAETGMLYLKRLPKAIPEDHVLVHNTVLPASPLGRNGFRAWLQVISDKLELCPCKWANKLGTHYRIAHPFEATASNDRES